MIKFYVLYINIFVQPRLIAFWIRSCMLAVVSNYFGYCSYIIIKYNEE